MVPHQIKCMLSQWDLLLGSFVMKAQMSISVVSVDLMHMMLVCILKVSGDFDSVPRDGK